MGSTITANIGEQTLTIDLSRVTGLDALTWRAFFGTDIESYIADLPGLAAAEVLPLADRALIGWLWRRQNGHPLEPIAVAAEQVTLFEGDG